MVALATGLSIAANAADFSAWGKKAEITFSGYTGTETLTNFPALVVLGSGTVSGFIYDECLADGACSATNRAEISTARGSLNAHKKQT